MSLDLDLTVRNRSAHLGFRRARRKWCGRWRCAPVVIDGGSAGAPGTREDVDEVRLNAGISGVRSMRPIASRSVEVVWPEWARAPVTFGSRWRTWFSAKKFKPRASRGASEQPKGNETREGVRKCLTSPWFGNLFRNQGDLRGAIRVAWRRNPERNEGEAGEEEEGG
jgi:hypothetical protein